MENIGPHLLVKPSQFVKKKKCFVKVEKLVRLDLKFEQRKIYIGST